MVMVNALPPPPAELTHKKKCLPAFHIKIKHIGSPVVQPRSKTVVKSNLTTYFRSYFSDL